MAKKQKCTFEQMVNKWNDILSHDLSDKTDMILQKKLDDLSKFLDDYESQLGINDDDYLNPIVK